MPFLELTLTSLEDLDDGRVAAAFAHEMKRAVQDCMDRPGDKKPRVVTLELKLTPVAETQGGLVECSGAHGEFSIKSKVPERRSKTYQFNANKKGQLSYSSNSPDNPDQTTFDDIDPQTGKVNRRGV